MTPFVDDPDFQLHVGDALEVLRELPAESVHCCVTSPPYWGLRDYGTGSWDGGDAECDHALPVSAKSIASSTLVGSTDTQNSQKSGYKDACGKCGATRVDQQLGLEPTPDLYVANMVNVFREVRRVLRADGTLWLNIGDSYAPVNYGANAKLRQESPNSDQTMQGKANHWAADIGGSRSQQMSKGAAANGIKQKDLCGIPWRLAFALQADGWYLRSDIIWSKPNPMPESVTDRPTKAHEYLFLLTKSPRYFWDADAIREPAQYGYSETTNGRDVKWHAAVGDATRAPTRAPTTVKPGDGTGGRNKRSVWEIATAPYPDAHFATFPPALVEPCIKAGTSEHGCCPECGAPWEREVERVAMVVRPAPKRAAWQESGDDHSRTAVGGTVERPARSKTIGWRPTCDHDHLPIAATVLDPFLGSGTTAQVARRLGRRSIGIELNPEYAELAARRLQQLSLFASEPTEA